ncbi:hypothetical protein BDV36DRAFT_227554 [Aspergillus pseudocaelatus]|uniref:Uncharacterized protein n=1 Tax=Aspergillus pseudocaelatus TaxID=1825620 RepID=A0ABQ6WDG1_9EURO|nr:hypothetical protein BDV36DRAFT_227554 [Aspergillus pseudocaelatus]
MSWKILILGPLTFPIFRSGPPLNYVHRLSSHPTVWAESQRIPHRCLTTKTKPPLLVFIVAAVLFATPT